jgi:hypothetical protein
LSHSNFLPNAVSHMLPVLLDSNVLLTLHVRGVSSAWASVRRAGPADIPVCCRWVMCIDKVIHKQVFEKLHLWWGYQRLHVNGTNFKFEAVSDLDGTVFDTVELQKPADWGNRWHQQNGEPSPRKVCLLLLPLTW